MSFLLAASPIPGADKLYLALGGVVVAVAVLVLDMVKSTIQSWRETRRKAKQSSLVYLAEKQVQLDQGTERMCLAVRPNHVALYRLHNGIYFEGDDSIKKMSMVSEAVNGMGIGRWKSSSQDMLMSNFPHLTLGLDGPTKQDFYVMQEESVLDFEMGRLMNEREYATSIALLIRGKKERPLAILILSWCTGHHYLNDLDTAMLESYRRDFSYTLSD
ncbi:MAG: hypothetical protein EOO62_38755 [Hymenobacter sp.]|nr:MAG: hypothetical protein EOO62_38755 [Hymenobacter sp.]